MVTCPEFDLFAHHKCPDPRPKHSAAWNLTSRMMQRQLFTPYGGFEGAKLDRKFLYSRFRPVRTYRCSEDQDQNDNVFYRLTNFFLVFLKFYVKSISRKILIILLLFLAVP